MNSEFLQLLSEFEREKGVSRDVLLDALETALLSAYHKNYDAHADARVEIDRETGEMRVYLKKLITTDVLDPATEIDLEDAKKINPAYVEGDYTEVETKVERFGRIAAQTARQVVMQRVRDAQRGIIYDEYAGRQNDIITGQVQRVERRSIMIDIGKTEVLLPTEEQVPGETYKPGDRIKIYVSKVTKTPKGPIIEISRSHPNLVKRLFELEVPEIAEGVVEIMSIAREAGSRTKLAVRSNHEDVDPIGACVGNRGGRVQAIVDELRNEKIDIVKYSEDVAEYVSAALSPAQVVSAVVNEEEHICTVTVEDSQLSLAIGKEGQNARLAAKLTGWKVDIIKAE